MDDNDKTKLLFEEVEIESSTVRKLLANSMTHYPPHYFDANMVNIRSPFRYMVWNWDQLTKAYEPIESDSEELKAAREDLRLLMSYVKGSKALETYFKNKESQVASKTISYKTLWTLFAPGTKVYAGPFLNDMQMFEVLESGYQGENQFIVYCSAFDWDGSHFQRYSYVFTIKEVDQDRRSISQLPCYPIEYYQNDKGEYDDSALRESLIERGKMFCSLCIEKGERSQCIYSGFALCNSEGMARLISDHSVSISVITVVSTMLRICRIKIRAQHIHHQTSRMTSH